MIRLYSKHPAKERRGSRRTFGTVVTVFALFTMSLAVQAQDLATIQNSIRSQAPGGTRYFDIDLNGDRAPDAELRIDDFTPAPDNSVNFTGRFHYVTGGNVTPDSANVTGSINLIQARAGARTGNAIRISFNVRATGLLGRARPAQSFEGALRIPLSRADAGVPFIAGVLDTGTGGVGGVAAPSPYPFAGLLLFRSYTR